jgi:hypothetical protein
MSVPLIQVPPPGVFYTYFYNHARCLRLQTLVSTEFSRSYSGFRWLFRFWNRRMAVSEVKQPLRSRVGSGTAKNYKGYNMQRPFPNGRKCPFGCNDYVCNGRGRWPKSTVLFWCGSLQPLTLTGTVLSQFASGLGLGVYIYIYIIILKRPPGSRSGLKIRTAGASIILILCYRKLLYIIYNNFSRRRRRTWLPFYI